MVTTREKARTGNTRPIKSLLIYTNSNSLEKVKVRLYSRRLRTIIHDRSFIYRREISPNNNIHTDTRFSECPASESSLAIYNERSVCPRMLVSYVGTNIFARVVRGLCKKSGIYEARSQAQTYRSHSIMPLRDIYSSSPAFRCRFPSRLV